MAIVQEESHPASHDGALLQGSNSQPVVVSGIRETLLANQRRMQLYWILWLLNAIDIVTTKLVLDRGGVEKNPVMKPLMEGLWGAVAIKVVVLGVIGVLITRCPPQSRRPDVALVLVTGWYLAVVSWNLAVLVKG